MNTELYINNQRADISEDITMEYSLNDIRNLESGSQQTTYDITLPLTPVNKSLIHYNHELDVKEEITENARIIYREIEVFRGKVQQINTKLSESKVIVKGNFWADAFKNLKLSTLDLSEYDHIYNTTNVQASWIADESFYRYPLVMFSTLSTEGTSWFASDFIPWFSIREVLLKIFSGYTVVSEFLDSSYFKNLYFLSLETIIDSSFLEDLLFDEKVSVISDNYVTLSVPAGATRQISLNSIVEFNNEITDEGSNFTAGTIYQIKKTGTYRFRFVVDHYETYAGLVLNHANYKFSIQRDGVDIPVATISGQIMPSGIYTLDTGYMHFTQSEEISCYVLIAMNVLNSSGGALSCTAYLNVDSEFKNFVNGACLSIGTGDILTISDWMPDVTQSDFIASVKHLFNLHFFMDVWNNTLYIEPAETWHTENQLNIGNAINQKDIEVELISTHYNKDIYFEFAEDKSDVFLSDMEMRLKTVTGQKKITLLSEYTKEDEQHIVNPLFKTFKYSFLPDTMGENPNVPRIWNSFDKNTLSAPNYRTGGYGMKVGLWEGMLSGDSWVYEGVTKTTYPKMSALDFNVLYPIYYIKTLHYIDKGKLVKVEIKPEVSFLQQFVTVIVDTAYEGFRLEYLFTVGGTQFVGILNRITFNGPRAILELILK